MLLVHSSFHHCFFYLSPLCLTHFFLVWFFFLSLGLQLFFFAFLSTFFSFLPLLTLLPFGIEVTLCVRELPSPNSVWLRQVQEGRKGVIRKHVREETEIALQDQIQCKVKYTSAFHYNHTPNSTFPLCLNYLSFLIKIDPPSLLTRFICHTLVSTRKISWLPCQLEVMKIVNI